MVFLYHGSSIKTQHCRFSAASMCLFLCMLNEVPWSCVTYTGRTTLTMCFLIAPCVSLSFSPWSEQLVHRLALILNHELGIKNNCVCQSCFYSWGAAEKEAEESGDRLCLKLFLISSPHMDSSRFWNINSMLSNNYLCVPLFKQMSIQPGHSPPVGCTATVSISCGHFTDQSNRLIAFVPTQKC